MSVRRREGGGRRKEEGRDAFKTRTHTPESGGKNYPKMFVNEYNENHVKDNTVVRSATDYMDANSSAAPSPHDIRGSTWPNGLNRWAGGPKSLNEPDAPNKPVMTILVIMNPYESANQPKSETLSKPEKP